MSYKIKHVTVADMRPQQKLLDRYATHKLDGMPDPVINWDLFQKLEDANLVHGFGCFKDDKLCGFISFTLSPSHHYPCLIAHVDSFFVLPQYRSGGVGIYLLDYAEAVAKQLGAHATFTNAIKDSPLDSALQKKGDRKHAYNSYFKVLV